MVVTWGDTAWDPDSPDGEKPVPLHALALVLVQLSVDNWPFTIEAGDAASVTVGAAWLACMRSSWTAHVAPPLLLDTSHQVDPSALAGPPTIVPFEPAAKTPFVDALIEAEPRTAIERVVRTVMPTARFGAGVTATVTD
jgi:hypothetical protein